MSGNSVSVSVIAITQSTASLSKCKRYVPQIRSGVSYLGQTGASQFDAVFMIR